METKEKSEKNILEINYEGSGVKTLSGFGTLFFVLAVISIIIAFLSLVLLLVGIESLNNMFYTIQWNAFFVSLLFASLFFAIVQFFFGALCKGLSTIAKGTLYQMSVVEKTFYVQDLPLPFLDEDKDD
jgi:hypothetical protein